MNDVGIGQHAEFDRLDLEIGEACIHLRLQKGQWWKMHGGDGAGVLRGQCGNRRQPVHAVRGEGLEVGLDAGAPAGVGAGDAQCRQRTGRSHVAILHCWLEDVHIILCASDAIAGRRHSQRRSIR